MWRIADAIRTVKGAAASTLSHAKNHVLSPITLKRTVTKATKAVRKAQGHVLKARPTARLQATAQWMEPLNSLLQPAVQVVGSVALPDVATAMAPKLPPAPIDPQLQIRWLWYAATQGSVNPTQPLPFAAKPEALWRVITGPSAAPGHRWIPRLFHSHTSAEAQGFIANHSGDESSRPAQQVEDNGGGGGAQCMVPPSRINRQSFAERTASANVQEVPPAVVYEAPRAQVAAPAPGQWQLQMPEPAPTLRTRRYRFAAHLDALRQQYTTREERDSARWVAAKERFPADVGAGYNGPKSISGGSSMMTSPRGYTVRGNRTGAPVADSATAVRHNGKVAVQA